MDKKSITILFVASCLTSSVFATGIINKLITKHSSVTPSIIKTHKTTNKTNHPYTDFSGTWTGNCGNSQIMSTVIENDAGNITLDGEEFRIGQGLQGKTASNEEYVRYEHNSFEWNEDGSALIMKGVGVYKDNVDKSDIHTDMGTFTLTMKNDQINLDGKFAMFQDVTQVDPITFHCVFTRKQ